MASTDKLRKASGSTRPVVTTLSLPKAAGATTVELTSATGWNTSTGVDVVIYRRQLNTTTGLYEKIDGTQTDWTGQLTGTTLAGMVLQAGTEPAAGYAADGNTVVLAGPTAQWSDDLIETLLTLFNQDQTLKPGPIQTALGLGASTLNGWNALGYAPNTVTNNGNRNYTLTFNSVDLTATLSAGMRLRTTRTVAASTQSTSLNGTTQYYSKSSPAGMTFTDDFVAGAWVKLSSYPSGNGTVISRYNGTSGWRLFVGTAGQVYLDAYNAGPANISRVNTYQSIPLNKWVHLSAQLDMSTAGVSTTTSYVMIDALDVPAAKVTGGTNPTALIQAGNLEIGSGNGGADLFPGKIAQAFVSNAKITQANVRTLYSQGLTSTLITANNIISAYSLSNTQNDLNTTNANNLTSNGSAVATNADSPFGDSGVSSTLDYAIITAKPTFSTNTVVTVQVPEGCTIPTSGGVASVVYSSNATPYGFPALSKFKLSAWDTSGTLTNVLIPNIQQYITDHPIDNLLFTNSGTGGGTVYLSVSGSERKASGVISAIATSSTGTAVFPTGFFTAVQSATATAGPVSGTGAVHAVIQSGSSFTTTSLVIALNASAGAGTMPVQYIALGS